MRKLRVLAAVAGVAVLVAGCGGGSEEESEKADGAPKTVAAWTAQFQKAVKENDCKALRRLSPFLTCQFRTFFRGARATGSRRFGTGAIVDFDGTRYPEEKPGPAQAVLVQRAKGEWAMVLDLPYPRPAGTDSGPTDPFVSTAGKWVTAVAEGKCKEAYKYAAVNEPEASFCKSIDGSQQVKVLASTTHTTPKPLGGTADVQFLQYTVHVPRGVSAKARWSHATLPVIHVPKELAEDATNPYLASQLVPAPTPADVAKEGPYTKAIRDRYVRNSGGARAACEIEMIAAGVPYPDFETPTKRFDTALRGVKRACRESAERPGSADEKKVAQIVLGGDLVPGYICSPEVSTDKIVPELGGTRQACAKGSGEAPPDNTVELTDVSVEGDSATVKGTDEAGRFTVSLVRQGGRWLVDGFRNEDA